MPMSVQKIDAELGELIARHDAATDTIADAMREVAVIETRIEVLLDRRNASIGKHMADA